MFKKIAAYLISFACIAVAIQLLVLADTPVPLRYVLDVLCGVLCFFCADRCLDYFAGATDRVLTYIDNYVDETDRPTLAEPLGLALLLALITAVLTGGVSYPLLALIYLDGLPLAYVVTIITAVAFAVGSLIFGIWAAIMADACDENIWAQLLPASRPVSAPPVEAP